VGDTTVLGSEIEADVNAAIMRDSDPYLRDYYADPAKATREARERAVDARVASMLIAAEAKKRGKSPSEIIDSEINTKLTAPNEQEIRAIYDANRSQLGGADLESVRPDVINYLRDQQKQTLYGALVARLKMTNVVNRNADVNAPMNAVNVALGYREVERCIEMQREI
jgi:hypothetical protein